jgi:hypothetical protein
MGCVFLKHMDAYSAHQDDLEEIAPFIHARRDLPPLKEQAPGFFF